MHDVLRLFQTKCWKLSCRHKTASLTKRNPVKMIAPWSTNTKKSYANRYGRSIQKIHLISEFSVFLFQWLLEVIGMRSSACYDVIGRAVECCPCWTLRSAVEEFRDAAAIGRVCPTDSAAQGPECSTESTERCRLFLHYWSYLLVWVYFGNEAVLSSHLSM